MRMVVARLGLKPGGQAEVVERVLAVVAADGEEARGGEALVEGVGERVADPVEVGLAGAVVEGEDEDETAAGLADVGCGGRRCGLRLALGLNWSWYRGPSRRLVLCRGKRLGLGPGDRIESQRG